VTRGARGPALRGERRAPLVFTPAAVARTLGRVKRYRCTTCGNLTRFDVTTTTRVRAFHHYTVGGELSVEEPQVLGEVVEAVECRWCGPSGSVEELDAEGTVSPPS